MLIQNARYQVVSFFWWTASSRSFVCRRIPSDARILSWLQLRITLQHISWHIVATIQFSCYDLSAHVYCYETEELTLMLGSEASFATFNIFAGEA